MGFLLILFVVFVANAPCLNAWDVEGHFMVCKIAESLLEDTTSRAVQDLLPQVARGELASVCSWADDVRKQFRWSTSLHFVNTPDICHFDYSRDCHDYYGTEGVCIVKAIYNYTRQLEGYGTSTCKYNLTESLMFLAHFMGDIHQPLHAGFRSDFGGNLIPVQWYQTKTNLHKVWDLNIIRTAMTNFYADNLTTMIEIIKMNITKGWSAEVSNWENCISKSVACPELYASESTRLACEYAYKGVNKNSTLGDNYFYSRLPVLEKRIAQAGVRLAQVLTRIFDKKDSSTRNPLIAEA